MIGEKNKYSEGQTKDLYIQLQTAKDKWDQIYEKNKKNIDQLNKIKKDVIDLIPTKEDFQKFFKGTYASLTDQLIEDISETVFPAIGSFLFVADSVIQKRRKMIEEAKEAEKQRRLAELNKKITNAKAILNNFCLTKKQEIEKIKTVKEDISKDFPTKDEIKTYLKGKVSETQEKVLEKIVLEILPDIYSFCCVTTEVLDKWIMKKKSEKEAEELKSTNQQEKTENALSLETTGAVVQMINDAAKFEEQTNLRTVNISEVKDSPNGIEPKKKATLEEKEQS